MGSEFERDDERDLVAAAPPYELVQQ